MLKCSTLKPSSRNAKQMGLGYRNPTNRNNPKQATGKQARPIVCIRVHVEFNLYGQCALIKASLFQEVTRHAYTCSMHNIFKFIMQGAFGLCIFWNGKLFVKHTIRTIELCKEECPYCLFYTSFYTFQVDFKMHKCKRHFIGKFCRK